MSSDRRGVSIALVAGLLCSGAPVSAGEEGALFYEVEGDHIVFTNTPTPSARPVPGMEPSVAAKENALPTTLYDPFIRQVAREYGLSPELIKAVALVESGFNPHAVSPKGAKGLMQLMPATARQYGVSDASDPLANLRAGTAHLRHLLDQFDGDLTLALAAYNAGAGAVRRYDGVPAYRETQDYVRKVQEKLGRTSATSQPARVTRKGVRTIPTVKLRVLSDGSVLLSN